MQSPPARPFGAEIARALARFTAFAAVVEVGIALYMILIGSFDFRVGPVHLSSWSMWAPLEQSVLLGMIAAGLFYRDASLRGSWDVVPNAIKQFLSGPASQVTRRILWAAVVLGLVSSLLVSYSVVRQTVILGSGEGGWIYGYFHPFTLRALAISALVSAFAGSVLVLGGPGVRRHEWLIVFAWVILALGLQALLRSLTPYSFEKIFVSGTSNSFYTVTQQYDASTVLRGFSDLRSGWPIHAQSNMPGKLLLVYALELVSNRPAVVAWLVVLVSNLGGIFLYFFVRDLFADRVVALYSLVLYLFVPGKLFFMPLLNTVTPAVVFVCAWLVLRWLRSGRAAYAAASGVAIFGLVLFEPLPLVMGLLFAALAARAIWRAELTWRRFVLQSGVLVAAFAAIGLVMYGWFGFNLLSALRAVAADAASFNVRAGRRYGVWVRQDLVDFVFSAGLCQIIVFGAAFANSVRRSERTEGLWAQPITLVCVALAAILMVADLAGVNRGEVIRLWIFLASLFQIPTAYVCARLNSRWPIVLVLAVTVLCDALGTSMIGFILP